MRERAADLIRVAAIIRPPNRRSLSVKAIVCSLILFVIHPGCATSRVSLTPPTPPSYEERASFGTIGVARAHFLPKTDINVIAKGRLAGAGSGAAAFLVAFLAISLPDLRNADEPDKVKWWVGTGLATLPVGAVYGAIVAMPGAEAASCEMLVREILGRMSPQEDLRDQILRAGSERTERQLVRVDGVGPKNIDSVATYDSLEGKGIDTVLEASVKRIELKANKWGSDPPLELVMEARSRLIRVNDGAVVNVNGFTHSSSPRKFAEWAADNAALLDKEYEDGVRNLALAIIDWNLTSKNRRESPADTRVRFQDDPWPDCRGAAAHAGAETEDGAFRALLQFDVAGAD